MQQHITTTVQKPIRDDIKGGYFLNKKLGEFSCADYRTAECYYIGDPIKVCVAFVDHKQMQHGIQADCAIASTDFRFTRASMGKLLALFFEKDNNNLRLQALISVWNKQAIRACELFGFTLEGQLREVANDGDRLVYSMLKREYHVKYLQYTQSPQSARSSGNSRGHGESQPGYTINASR